MLHLIVRLIPAPLHRLILRTVHRVRVVWWRIAPREPDDTRVVALNEAGRVLLVRHSYGSSAWMLPGGGSKRGEDALATAARELREETGCTLVAPREVSGAGEDARKRRFMVVGRASGTVAIDGREIVEAQWFPPEALPEGASPSLRAHLAHWLTVYGADVGAGPSTGSA